MKSLLEQNGSTCDRFQDWLENSGDARTPLVTLEIFVARAPAELREHAQACADCRAAAADIVALRNLLRELGPPAEAGPWFAPRVLSAIAARETELSRAVSTWLAVPKFASRLSWIAAALLVVTCTWLYQRPVSLSSVQQSASAFASEHLFDPPALPANHDDVLVSLNEQNQ